MCYIQQNECIIRQTPPEGSSNNKRKEKEERESEVVRVVVFADFLTLYVVAWEAQDIIIYKWGEGTLVFYESVILPKLITSYR